MKPKTAYLICPVRNISDAYREGIQAQADYLENIGYTLHFPPRDTYALHSLGSCEQNRHAIQQADVVFIIWDGKSEGCLFDLGMAYAMEKNIIPIIGYFPNLTTKPSFQNMVYQYTETPKTRLPILLRIRLLAHSLIRSFAKEAE